MLAGMILVSFTGMRLLIHHCFACDTTDVVLAAFAPEACDAFHDNHHTHSHCEIHGTGYGDNTPCCENAEEGLVADCQDCCDTEHHYARTEYRVVQENLDIRVLPQEMEAPFVKKTDLLNPISSHVEVAIVIPPEPPPGHWGRDFVIFSHQLKYC